MYTGYEQSENKITKIIPFIIVLIQYLGINLTKKLKTYTLKITKHCWKELKDKKKKPQDIPCSWFTRLNIVKWQSSTNWSRGSKQLLSKL